MFVKFAGTSNCLLVNGLWTLPVLLLMFRTSGVNAEWKLIWSDEFNGNKLNDSNWIYETGPWLTNDELQYYTDHREENVRVEQGRLIIEALPEKYGGREFTSGRLRSRHSFAFGKFEARARMPNGLNLWPAIWAFPKYSVYGDHPRSGEIDIMEMDCSNTKRYSGSIHAGANPQHIYSRTTEMQSFPDDFSADFHLFGLEWTRKEMRFLCDGKKFFTIKIDKLLYPGTGPMIYTKPGQPFDKPFAWVLNLAVGGTFFGNPPYITPEKARKFWKQNKLEIDWVRNYHWAP